MHPDLSSQGDLSSVLEMEVEVTSLKESLWFRLMYDMNLSNVITAEMLKPLQLCI